MLPVNNPQVLYRNAVHAQMPIKLEVFFQVKLGRLD
jgi:hypothetical protein